MSRIAPPICLDPAMRNQLQSLVRSPSTPQALVTRSQIVLAAAAGDSNQQIAASLKMPPITVSKWRRAFAAGGLEGLEDRPRSGRPPKHGTETWQKVQQKVCERPQFQSRMECSNYEPRSRLAS